MKDCRIVVTLVDKYAALYNMTFCMVACPSHDDHY